MVSYLDNGCPKSKPNLFPFLDLAKLDEDDRRYLRFKLIQDVENIMESFAKLVYNICKSIESRGVDVHKLAQYALNFGAYASRENQNSLVGEDEKELTSSAGIFQQGCRHRGGFGGLSPPRFWDLHYNINSAIYS